MQKTISDNAVSDSIKLLQITDTHLFASEAGSLLSVNTLQSFQAVVKEIIHREVSYDFILATGDISQDHTEVSYQRFVEGIKPLKEQCYWLPGNHDYKPSMTSVLPTDQIVAVEHALLGEHWQMIMLDSQVVGVPHGRLSDQQLDILQQKLSENPERHTLVLLHHPPRLVGSEWLDQHTLKDADAFWHVLGEHNNVRGILCGHVHQDMNCLQQGVRVMSTPSTCVQFLPNSNDFALDPAAPGWRELELHADGTLTTQVQRLTTTEFAPDFSSDGY